MSHDSINLVVCECLGAVAQTKISSITKCNIMLRVLYGNPFPEKKQLGIFKVVVKKENENGRPRNIGKNAKLVLPSTRNDSIHLLGGVVDTELSRLFLRCWSADIACPGHRLFFSRRCAVGAIGAIGDASIIESSHNRVETIFW